MNQLKELLLKSGFKPSPELILEGKIKNYFYLEKHRKFDEASKVLNNIYEYAKKYNLKLPFVLSCKLPRFNYFWFTDIFFKIF